MSVTRKLAVPSPEDLNKKGKHEINKSQYHRRE